MRIAMAFEAGIRNFKSIWARKGRLVPPDTFAELRRDQARLHLIMDQGKEIEKTRLQRIQRSPDAGAHAMYGFAGPRQVRGCATVSAKVQSAAAFHRRFCRPT